MRARRCATHSAAAVTVVAVVVAAVAVFGLALDTHEPGDGPGRADDQQPGAPLAVGATVTDSVGRMDANACTRSPHGRRGGPRPLRTRRVEGSGGRLHLLIPGARTCRCGSYDELTYELSGGKTQLSWRLRLHPARSGTYYLWVEWWTGALDYSLSVTGLCARRTSDGGERRHTGIPLGSTA
jgi:hypothetical protein